MHELAHGKQQNTQQLLEKNKKRNRKFDRILHRRTNHGTSHQRFRNDSLSKSSRDRKQTIFARTRKDQKLQTPHLITHTPDTVGQPSRPQSLAHHYPADILVSIVTNQGENDVHILQPRSLKEIQSALSTQDGINTATLTHMGKIEDMMTNA